jgi:hypothetical protein
VFGNVIGVAGIVAFAIAVILDLADIDKGHVNQGTFALIGFLCLAIYLVWALWNGWRGRAA